MDKKKFHIIYTRTLTLEEDIEATSEREANKLAEKRIETLTEADYDDDTTEFETEEIEDEDEDEDDEDEDEDDEEDEDEDEDDEN